MGVSTPSMQDVLSILPIGDEDSGFGARAANLYGAFELPVRLAPGGGVVAETAPLLEPLLLLLATTVEHCAARRDVDRETVIFELLDIITRD